MVPCYNEEEVLPLFYEEFCKVSRELQKFDMEVLLVDDGSKDKTLEIAKALSQNDSRIKYLSFSRNFGKEAAIYAGLKIRIILKGERNVEEKGYIGGAML